MDVNTKCKDYDIIAESTNLAPGDNLYTPWFTDSEWVRDLLLFHENDQNIDIELQRRDASGDITNLQMIGNLPISSGYSVYRYGELMGASFRFRITNNSGLVITVLKLKMQAFGF